jgi:2-octaprenyl-6-methoxyphenol hydroxylase
MTERLKRNSGDIRADVLIVGGGLVGGTLACALGDAGMIVAVVDAADPTAVLKAGFDGRASAIALSSRRLLEGVGLWDGMKNDAAPMLDIRVSEGRSNLFLHYDHHDIGEEPFGHMVENRVFRKALFHRMREIDGIHSAAPARVSELARSADGIEAR